MAKTKAKAVAGKIDQQASGRPTPRPRAATGKGRGTRMSEVMGKPKSASAEPLDRFSKTNHAYTILRSQILDGVYLPGDWLRMSRIAASLKLSEMPVREALRLLEKDGLVVMHLHRGAQVAALSFERALEITEVRMHLEYWAALESAPHHTPQSLDAAEAALKRMEIAVDDPVVFAIRNREFATAIYAKCPNNFMREHIQHLWDLGWQYSSTSVFNVMRHRIEDSLVENRHILALLRDGQPDALLAVFDARLMKSSDAWKAAIQRSRQTGGKRTE